MTRAPRRHSKQSVNTFETYADLDTDEASVPGLRRGFAIVPIGPRPGEQTGDFRRRIRDSLQQIREAKIVTGT